MDYNGLPYIVAAYVCKGQDIYDICADFFSGPLSNRQLEQKRQLLRVSKGLTTHITSPEVSYHF